MQRWVNRQPRQARLSRTLFIASRPLLTCLGLALAFAAGPIEMPVSAQLPKQADEAIAQTPVRADVIYVNPAQGTDAENGGSETRPLRTISYALERASGTTVIQLASGTYTADTGEQFPLRLKPGIVLLGNESNNGQTVSIIGGNTFVTALLGPQSATLVASDDSEIRGVTVTNPTTRGTGVWVESVNPIDPLIRNSTFTNNARDGVFVNGSAVPTIERNRFVTNEDNGISLTRNAGGTIRNNEFVNTGFGIVVSDSASPVIEGNEIRENIDGVVATTNSRPVLRENVIQRNIRDGLVAIGNARPDLGTADDPGENIIVNNGRYAVLNATRGNRMMAIGNQVNEDEIEGEVEFVARVIGFPDVQGHWAQPYIEALAAQDIIGGFPDGTYRPNDPVTRAQFAAILNKAFTSPPKRTGQEFVDVQRSFWGYSAIQSAYQRGFLSGYPGQVFLPSRDIPRVQVLVSLASGLELNSSSATALNKYQDASQIPDWAVGAIAAATQENLVVNYPTANRLNPNTQATRADVAAFVYQALVQAGQAEPIESEFLVTFP
ncbi:MAG: DUF1565 domain-containing protein [Elainellaceae cyanobacterium]